MNWIKSLWSKLVSSTSTSPTLVLVEEVDEDTTEELPPAAEILEQILLDAEHVANSIQSFKEAMGGAINAKLNKVK